MNYLFQLRKHMIEHVKKTHIPLMDYIYTWNEKLSQGIPIPQDMLSDLFGNDLYKKFQDEVISSTEISGQTAILSIGPWVNPDNPFQVIYVYKVQFNKDIEFFNIGEESILIDFCLERGFYLCG
ncbi:hypothetical protein [Bacillus velezensis]|uniref:hypothetical protein n=1 Tax=Bacillus velezensis TaxID=492670 RepID=UPI001A928502|nr:hypothetical protein [Bacillus velezensis]BCT30402.1 hypothetical protein BVAD3_40760 [Bacillus velezensis]